MIAVVINTKRGHVISKNRKHRNVVREILGKFITDI